MKTLIVCFLWTMAVVAGAQEARPWEEYLSEVMTLEDAGSAAWEETYELLGELEQHPLDINTVSRERLEELPFLSAQQIEDIMAYRWRYGALRSLGELRMVRSLGDAQCRLLSYFVYAGEEKSSGFPSLRTIAKYGKQELVGTARVPCYERRGDRDGYLGHPYRHWLRYQLTYGDTVKAGLVGAQDAGEPFFAGRNRWGYDYYAWYLQLRNVGRIESLVLGNYRVSMGMGLVMNNSFGLGKVAMLQQMGRPTYSVRAHSSRSVGSLRGAAVTVAIGKGLRLTGFVSYNPADATLNKDGTAATILTTGYHRAETEMEKKHNLNMTKTGGSLRYGRNGLHLGVNALYTHLDRTLNPNTSALYRQYYPQGSDFMNGSLDYGVVRSRLALNGETAVDKNGHLATINTLSLRLGETVSLMALQRFYSYRYSSLDAQSYSDGGNVRNESGVYLGLTWQPSACLRLTAYTDYAYFAWAKYRVSQSSYSWDHLLQAVWQRHGWTLSGRYRMRLRQRDDEGQTALVNRTEHRGRLSAEYAGRTFGCRTQIDVGYCQYGGGEWGGMLSESLWYTRGWLRLNGGIGYFHTDSYDSRVYLYERGPLYTYSLAQFYGEGLRYWLMVRAALGRHVGLTVKAGVTDYFDRSTVGSGYQQVDASSLTDVDMQLRWTF